MPVNLVNEYINQNVKGLLVKLHKSFNNSCAPTLDEFKFQYVTLIFKKKRATNWSLMNHLVYCSG